MKERGRDIHTGITTINALENGSVVRGMKRETYVRGWSRSRVNCRTERGGTIGGSESLVPSIYSACEPVDNG